jgi:hypothetical protein
LSSDNFDRERRGSCRKFRVNDNKGLPRFVLPTIALLLVHCTANNTAWEQTNHPQNILPIANALSCSATQEWFATLSRVLLVHITTSIATSKSNSRTQ